MPVNLSESAVINGAYVRRPLHKSYRTVLSQAVRRKIPFIYRQYILLRQHFEEHNLEGQRKSLGDKNADRTFFIIRIDDPHLGLMAIYNCVVGYLRFAEKRGYVAVVDLMNFPNGYLDRADLGNRNAWEYYFEQPSSFSLKEVYESRNVVFAAGISPKEAHPMVLSCLLTSRSHASKYFSLIQSRLRIRDDVLRKIDAQTERLIRGKKVIGVVNRGSDLVNVKGHAVQPKIEEVIKKTREMLRKWDCHYVFLASEEAHVVEEFRSEFADQLIVNESKRVTVLAPNTHLVDVSFGRENDKYLKGLEYLTTVVILSRCNCLIGSLVGATIGAMEMNRGRYEHTYIFDLGVY